MLDGGLTLLDGTQLQGIDLTLPDQDTTLTGAQLLDIADSRVSASLFGLSAFQSLKSSVLKRINTNEATDFLRTELDPTQASQTIELYVAAIADELKEDPFVVSVLDGNNIRLFLEDEDDFAMLAENLFTDLDAEDKGKIHKSEIRNALVHMGVEMGVPPFTDFPLLNDILKKHGAEGEEELGQGQFAELLQPVLQDLAEALTENHVVVVQNVKIVNGSKLRKTLADEKQLSSVVEKIWLEKESGKATLGIAGLVRSFFEKNGFELGLPPSESNDEVVLLYDAVFKDMDNNNNKRASETDKDDLSSSMMEILVKFAEQLEANPVFYTDH